MEKNKEERSGEKQNRKELRLDEGYQFGLGVFETIAVERGVPLLLEEHLRRMERSMRFLGIEWKGQGLRAEDTAEESGKEAVFQNADRRMPEDGKRDMREDMRRQIRTYLRMHSLEHGALKLMVSAENAILTHRPNPYTADRYEKGFQMDYSRVLRNETSPLVFHKTLNYGDCILEKRNAAAKGVDELIFLNTKGQLCEGTATNLFFVKSGKLYTPEKKCGLLPGIMRDWIIRREAAAATILFPEAVGEFEECFVTNSLLGIMPVVRLGNHEFQKRETADRLLWRWRKDSSRRISFGRVVSKSTP